MPVVSQPLICCSLPAVPLAALHRVCKAASGRRNREVVTSAVLFGDLDHIELHDARTLIEQPLDADPTADRRVLDSLAQFLGAAEVIEVAPRLLLAVGLDL